MQVNDGLRKDLFQKQLENEDLRQRLQILEALTGRDTSFISIMEDTSMNMINYFGNSSSKSTAHLDKIDEEKGVKAYNKVKPPKSLRKGNLGPGTNHMASDMNIA